MSDKKEQLEQFERGFASEKIIPPNESLRADSSLEGYIGSGLIFIGDPGYMAGDLSEKGSEAILDPYNPFRDFENFLDQLGETDKNMLFPDSDQKGRGVVLHTNRITGKFSIQKEYDESGRLRRVIMDFKD